MSNESEIKKLYDRGFVILRAARATNAPIGWKRKPNPTNKIKWGYAAEMADPLLTVYHSTFSASILSRSHCGFYLGHGNLCCIDLDTKKVTPAETLELKNSIIKKMAANVVVEKTKSDGYHIYFLYEKREDNQPDWTGLGGANWIELYYSKRFIACYLSNSKKYQLEHGDLLKLKPLTTKQHAQLISILQPYRKAEKNSKPKKIRQHDPADQETWDQAEAYVKQLEDKELDITGDNPEWFKIGKAFANAFGVKGYDMFNRLSQFSPKYNADTIETQYENFCNGEVTPRDRKITIATFFKICADNGLNDLSTLATLKAHPLPSSKEFELTLSKKERMPEHVHTLVSAFLQHVEICCIDQASFYIFEQTHWIKRNAKYVVDLLNNFVDRSDVEDRYRKLLRTLPYLDMAIRELKLITMRDALEPRTGNLHDGIFINLENGVLHVNIKTGKRKLLDHESSYNFTTLLPYCYEPAALCPKFDQWINTQIPDKTLHTAYFAFVASCLSKHRADIIMLLVGDTSTGKSSLIEITRRVIGLENSAAVSAGILFGGTAEAQTQAMQMENKLLAYDFDSQPFQKLEMLLKVAAQEPLPGWQMHVTRRPVINYGRLLIAMNRFSYSVFNPAVARRLITIAMDVRVEKDNTVMPAIYDNELAGIFNHILNIGIKHLIENGGQIKITDAMRKATEDFHMRDKDAILWFRSRYIVPKVSEEKSNKFTALQKLQKQNPKLDIELISISKMYGLYREWLVTEEGGYVPEIKIQIRKHFAEDLKNIGIVETLYKLQNGDSERGIYLHVIKVGRSNV